MLVLHILEVLSTFCCSISLAGSAGGRVGFFGSVVIPAAVGWNDIVAFAFGVLAAAAAAAAAADSCPSSSRSLFFFCRSSSSCSSSRQSASSCCTAPLYSRSRSRPLLKTQCNSSPSSLMLLVLLVVIPVVPHVLKDILPIVLLCVSSTCCRRLVFDDLDDVCPDVELFTNSAAAIDGCGNGALDAGTCSPAGGALWWPLCVCPFQCTASRRAASSLARLPVMTI
eukprot:4798791-Amphidinium_carterae.2